MAGGNNRFRGSRTGKLLLCKGYVREMLFKSFRSRMLANSYPTCTFCLNVSLRSCQGQCVYPCSAAVPLKASAGCYHYFFIFAIIASFSADRGSSRFTPRSGFAGRTGGSYANYSARGGHSYSSRNEGSNYNSGISKPDNRYQDRSMLQGSTAQTSLPNLGEKRSFSQASLNTSGSYQLPAKISKSGWGNTGTSTYPQGVSQVQNAPQEVASNNWSGSPQSWGKTIQQTIPASSIQVSTNNQWSKNTNNNSVYNPAPMSSQVVSMSAKPVTGFSQPPPPTISSASGIGAAYQSPPPPPPVVSQPLKSAAFVPQLPKQPANYVAQPPPPPTAGYTQYMNQAPPGYPQVPPQAWSQSSWPQSQQHYPGY